MNAIKIIKEILKRSEDTHNIFTPFELCNEMLDKIPELNKDQVIIVMFNLEFLYLLRERFGKENMNNIWFLTPCELKKEAAKNIGINENKVITYSYKDNKIIEGEKKMPKFDCVIQNPPYLGTMHLKFLENGFNMLNENGKMLIINPSSWLILLREGKTKQKYDALKEKIGKYVKSVEFFKAQKYFEFISPYVPLELIFIDKTNKNEKIEFKYYENTKKINNLYEINLIGEYSIIKSIENKIKEKTEFYINNFIKKNKGNFYVNLSGLVGNGYMTIEFYDGIIRKYQNIFNLVNNTTNKITIDPIYAKSQSKNKVIGNIKNYISFETKNEAQNFLDFITKSKLCKYLLITYNIDQHIESTYNLIPWLDWKKNLNDKELYNYFNLDINEITLIEETIENNIL